MILNTLAAYAFAAAGFVGAIAVLKIFVFLTFSHDLLQRNVLLDFFLNVFLIMNYRRKKTNSVSVEELLYQKDNRRKTYEFNSSCRKDDILGLEFINRSDLKISFVFFFVLVYTAREEKSGKRIPWHE